MGLSLPVITQRCRWVPSRGMQDPRPSARVTRVVTARIADGTYAPGARIHLGLLGEELGIGPDTIRKVMLELEAAGLVRRWPGLGWYVEGEPAREEPAP
jgi:DNA-binding GntR family transcriptional regulator